MWERRRLFSAGGFSKALWEVWESLRSRCLLDVAGDFSTLSTMPSFPQRLFSFRMGLASPYRNRVECGLRAHPIGGTPHVENSPLRHLDLLQVHQKRNTADCCWPSRCARRPQSRSKTKRRFQREAPQL